MDEPDCPNMVPGLSVFFCLSFLPCSVRSGGLSYVVFPTSVSHHFPIETSPAWKKAIFGKDQKRTKQIYYDGAGVLHKSATQHHPKFPVADPETKQQA